MNAKEWLRLNYDRAALVAGALFLLLSSFFIWQRAAGFAESFAGTPAAAAGRKTSTLPSAGRLIHSLEKIRQPAQWTFAGRSGLFVPERHFISANGRPATLQNTEIHPPVPNAWLEQFSLPITDADVLAQDPDEDGFTNLDEWQGRTNPTEKNSHPDFLSKLKLKSFVQERFRLVFSSWVGDTFQINTIDLKEPTQFLKLGDVIRGTRFKVVKFEEKRAADKYGTEQDVSELTLEHEGTGDLLLLVKEKVSISPESVANFVYSWGERREFAVRKDQEFSLPPQDQIRYKLVDVQPDKAVIVNVQKPEERIEIGLLAE